MANIALAHRVLYLTYGLLPIIAGADKFFNYVVHWIVYLNPSLLVTLQMMPDTLMRTVGVIEIVAGLLVLFRPRLGGYVVAAWLIAFIGESLVRPNVGIHRRRRRPRGVTSSTSCRLLWN